MTAPAAPAALAAFPAALRPRIAALVETERAAAYDSGFRAGYAAGERDAIKRMLRVVPPDSGKVAAIKRAVAERYGLPVSEMSSSRRGIAFARPRQIAMALCLELTGRSTPEIGRYFGGRDHSTVIHARDRIAELVRRDPQLAAEVETLRAQAARAA